MKNGRFSYEKQPFFPPLCFAKRHYTSTLSLSWKGARVEIILMGWS